MAKILPSYFCRMREIKQKILTRDDVLQLYLKANFEIYESFLKAIKLIFIESIISIITWYTNEYFPYKHMNDTNDIHENWVLIHDIDLCLLYDTLMHWDFGFYWFTDWYKCDHLFFAFFARKCERIW